MLISSGTGLMPDRRNVEVLGLLDASKIAHRPNVTGPQAADWGARRDW